MKRVLKLLKEKAAPYGGAGLLMVLSTGLIATNAHATAGVTFDQSAPVTLEQENQASDNTTADLDVELDLSFNGSSAEVEPGYLYFSQLSTKAASLNESSTETLSIRTPVSQTSFTPRSAVAGAVSEKHSVLADDWLNNSFTPRQADAHLTFGYQPGDEDGGSKIGIALSSSVKIEEVELPGVSNSSLSAALNRQSYRVGVDFGYSGFRIGASLREDSSVLADTTRGYGVGLSYTGSDWSTSLNVGEYNRKYRNVFGNFSQYEDSFYSYELGASYHLNRSLKFSGGVRYVDFSGRDNYTLLENPEAQVFYLGTNLSF